MLNKGGFAKFLVILSIIVFSIFVFSLNNSITGKIVTEAPDLVLADLGVNLHSESHDRPFLANKVIAVVCNNDRKNAVSNFDVRFYLHGRLINELKNGRLEPRECSDVGVSFKPFLENVRYVDAFAIVDPANRILETSENNNRFRSVLNLSVYGPNLEISDVDLVESGNVNDARFRVRFCNTSPKVSVKNKFYVGVIVDGIKRQLPYSLNLPPDSCDNIYTSSLNDFGIKKKSEVSVEAIADFTDFIVESEEKDNYFSRKFSLD